MPFLDELSSGIVPLGAPEVAHDFALPAGLAVGGALFAMQALAAVVEPPLFLLARRFGRRWFVAGGLGAIAITSVVAAWSHDFWVALACLAIFGPAVGLSNGLSQAELVDEAPDDAERTLARWSLSGTLGDLATPVLLAVIGSWRGAYLGAAAVAAALALVATRHFRERPVEEDDEKKTSLREALRKPGVLRWSFGVTLCFLLDEPLVAFGAIALARFGGAPVLRYLALSSWMVGGLIGVAAVDRLVTRVKPVVLLSVFSAAATVAALALAAAPSLPLASAAMFVVGLVASPLYPLAKAQAYRALPGESELVGAVDAVLLPFELVAPVALGLLSDRFGPAVALAALAAQPAYLWVLSRIERNR